MYHHQYFTSLLTSKMHVKVTIIVLIMIISFATSETYNHQQDVSSRSNGIDRRKPGQDDQLDTFLNVPQYPPTGCGSCKDREEIKMKNLETIKTQVLNRMGFKKAPNITGRVLPHVPQHFLSLYDQTSMQSDEPIYKTGPSIVEEIDDFHVKTEKVITFAQQCK